MDADRQVFLDALNAKRRLSVTFFSRKEDREKTRICAPMDIGPLRGAIEPVEHFQLWDLEGRKKPLNIAVLPSDVRSITVLEEMFDPKEIITWQFKPNAWHVTRDWGEFS